MPSPDGIMVDTAMLRTVDEAVFRPWRCVGEYGGAMSWFLVSLRCTGPSGNHARDALYDLDDDVTAVVRATAAEAAPRAGRQTVELVLGIDAQDATTAVARAKAILAVDPDYELVSVGEVSETTNPRALSAQAQAILGDATEELRDELRADIRTLREGGDYDDTIAVSEHLPAIYAHHYSHEVIAEWARSIEAVAGKLAAYPDTYLASTAEELAGHALIGHCEILIDEREGELDDPVALREKFSELHDLAFEDHDVLLLFDARFDGIEDSDIAKMMGMANLHVRDWFKPFRSDD